MNVLVTGGSGFVGSHLVEELVKKKYKVSYLDAKERKTSYLRKVRAEFIHGNILNKKELEEICDFDGIFHLAAALDATVKDKSLLYKVNVEGTKNVVEACKKNHVGKLIHCSSTGIVGPTPKSGVNESFKGRPLDDYSLSKLLGEEIVQEEIKKQAINATIIRPPAIVFGPRDFSNMFKLFQAIERGRFFVIGDGKNIIHTVYVKNLVEGIVHAFETDNAVGETYILANEEKTSIEEISKTIAETLGKKTPKIHLPVWLAKILAFSFVVPEKFFGFSSPLTPKRIDYLTQNRVFDISKAKREIGYNPKTSFREGIEKTVNWYKENNYL